MILLLPLAIFYILFIKVKVSNYGNFEDPDWCEWLNTLWIHIFYLIIYQIAWFHAQSHKTLDILNKSSEISDIFKHSRLAKELERTYKEPKMSLKMFISGLFITFILLVSILIIQTNLNLLVVNSFLFIAISWKLNWICTKRPPG